MPKFSQILVVVAALAIGLTISACSGGGAASGGGGQNITVTSLDTLKFDPSTISAKAGQPINITLDNSNGNLVHDFSLVGRSEAVTAQPKAKATLNVTLPAGTYQFQCNQPGHADAGMKGTLTVS